MSLSAILQVSSNELEVFDARGNFIGSLDQDTLLTVAIDGDTVGRLDGQRLGPITLDSVLPLAMTSELIEGHLLHSVDSVEGAMAAGATVYFRRLSPDGSRAAIVAGFLGEQKMAASLNARLFIESSFNESNDESDEMENLDFYSLRDAFVVGPQLEDSGVDSASSLLFGGPTCSCKSGSCRISSPWGPRKSRNGSRGKPISSFHRGVDVSDYGKSGAPIVASEDGCISKVLTNRKAGYGLTIFLRHNANLTTQYSHLQKFSVTKGCVKKGAVLGSMGSTGNVTGPHVHFAVLNRGTYEDPVGYVSSSEIISDSKTQCASTKSVGNAIFMN